MMRPMAHALLGPGHELGDRPALRVGERSLSYGELRGAAAAVARRLEGTERVAVWAEPSLETCVAVVGALCAGVPLVPLNPKLGESELRHIRDDSAPELVFGGPDGEPVDVDARGGELPDDDHDPEHTALVIYTSGTTGRPKGALLPRRAIASNLDALADAWEWTEEDRLTHALPLFHVHGLGLGLLGPLSRGGGLRHLVRFDPTAVADALEDGGTMLFGVPTMYRRLAGAPDHAAAL